MGKNLVSLIFHLQGEKEILVASIACFDTLLKTKNVSTYVLVKGQISF